MNEHKPTLDPSGNASANFGSAGTPVPTESPPRGGASAAAEYSRVPEAGAAQAGSAPTLPLEVSAVTGITASVWHNNKRVTALWCINENRNAWIGVEGLGWKRLSTQSDQGVVALNMLCAHAREKESTVNLREDGAMIREIYVW